MTISRTREQWIGLLAGVVACACILGIESPLHRYGEHGDRVAAAAGITVLMAIWWLTEALPITWTACVPLIAFPLFGVFADAAVDNVVPTVKPYVDGYIFLFAGGMGIAAAMQQCDLHRRIALSIMHRIGTRPARLLLGMLVATAFISMWISNTATAALMMPIGLAIIHETEHRLGIKKLHAYGAALMLAVAYAANLGGIGTKIGTAPNAQFAQFMDARGDEVSFMEFLAIGTPFVVLMLPITWWQLWRLARRDAPRDDIGHDAVESALKGLGRIKPAEKVVLGVFLATAAAWIASKPLTDALRSALAPMLDARGWRLAGGDVEGGIAMLAMFALMVAKTHGRRVLELRSLALVPWSTLLLLGGAFSMAKGIEVSGLSQWLGDRIDGVRHLPPLAQILLTSLATVTLSAFTSNTATISVLLPLLAGVVDPQHAPPVLFAATIAASCDFALPAGTPPNAIVFGSGYLTVRRMASTGVVLDLLAALV
ncbi:MAG: SLC13/DASS family transporter, partial [Planctomycetes bacterium]|nr:SLC13/DASS family transporter [Planctomycetota bacterium]